MEDKVLNIFTGGLDYDSLPELTPQESYKMAVNAVDQTLDHSNFGIANELGNKLCFEVEGTIKGWSYIEDINSTLLFVYDGDSKLYLANHDNCEVTFIVSDAEFGCDWAFDRCEFLYGEFKRFNACEELHVYWSSGCVYFVVNIDEMLNAKRKQAILATKDCDYFQVFRATCSPTLNTSASKFAGGMLEGGVVQFALQFRDEDYNYSNVFSVSQPVYLDTDDNIPGQVANGAAQVHVSGIDPEWRDVIVYVIHTVGGVETIKRMPARGTSSSGFSFTYYGQQGELVPATTLYRKHNAFLRGKDLVQKDGKMYFYNTVREKNLNYQKYANQIKLNAAIYEVSLEQQERYHFPSLMRGEVYAIGIVWNYLDGTHSPAFHIPGSGIGDVSARGDEETDVGLSEPRIPNVELLGQDGDPFYNPISTGLFNTINEVERLRNPNSIVDRPQESDSLEDHIQSSNASFTTEQERVNSAAECVATSTECLCCDCNDDGSRTCTARDELGNIIEITQCVPDEPPNEKTCDCSSLPDAVSEDMPKMSSQYIAQSDILSGYGLDQPDPSVTDGGGLSILRSPTIKDAAQTLVEDGVKNREYTKYTKPKVGVRSFLDIEKIVPQKQDRSTSATLKTELREFKPGGGAAFVFPAPPENLTSGINLSGERGDNWVDLAGNSLTDEPIPRAETVPFNVYYSEIDYPDDRDCNGERFYPEGSVRHFQVPDTSKIPHFYSTQNGVVNKFQPNNYEWAETTIRLVGIHASSIHIPTNDELPKPLCTRNPYSIVYVKRTQNNKRVFAKGLATGMFKGEVYGREYLYPRHGVNSFETVDAFISPANDPNSRMGEKYDGPHYTFHSPDTDADRSFLPVTRVRSELRMIGSGWRHGLYSKGKEPVEDQWNGTRKDNLGARVSNNLNHYIVDGTDHDLEGISYAPANTVVSTPAGMDYPLMNRYRESSVYLKSSGVLAGSETDSSFVGDVLTHFGPTIANASYIGLYRDLPDQYGSVESLQYIKIGLEGRTQHLAGANIEGICGDSWIGAYSKRRTSYVSNKKGDVFNVPQKPGSPCRPRTICNSPEDKIFEYLGVDYYPTRLPESGDKWDPKNYAGLHTIAGDCGPYGRSKTLSEAILTNVSESDFYYPGTLKSLVTTVVESNINPYFLQTGEGPQLEEGKVYYPKLKELYLDSDAPAKHPWEESFLNRFYKEIEQPSLRQRTLKTAIRTMLNLIFPAGGLMAYSDMETILGTVVTMAVFPMLSAMWVLANNTLFNDDRLNKLLGIPGCKRDSEGGDLDNMIKQWEDIYSKTSWDYTKVNDFNIYFAFPMPYNTCEECYDCDANPSDLIFVTSKQNPTSEIDAYRKAKLTHYFEIPSTAGRIQRIFRLNGELYVHTTEGILPVFTTDEGELVASPQLLGGGAVAGVYGTHSPNASIITPFGYFFIDEEAEKLYRFDGSGAPEEISTYFVRKLFQKYTEFCELTDCYDEKITGTSYYSLGWDPKFERILFTKNEVQECNSITLSYAPRKQRWISVHTYHPNGYIWDRGEMFSVISDKGEVWQHHQGEEYGKFYDEDHEFMVEFVVHLDMNSAGLDMGDAFRPVSLKVDLEVWDGEEKDLDHFFSHVWFRNSDQSSGLRPIAAESDNRNVRTNQRDRSVQDLTTVTFTKDFRQWNTNEIKDLVSSACTYFNLEEKDCDCQLIPNPNEDIIDCTQLTKQDYQNRHMTDQYLVIRFLRRNQGTKLMHLKKVISKIQKNT